MHVFGGMKKLVQLKFVQLLLLNRVKGKMIKKPCCSRFLLHKFVQLKYFWTQFKNVHLQGPCSLRPCISRPYYDTWSWLAFVRFWRHPKDISKLTDLSLQSVLFRLHAAASRPKMKLNNTGSIRPEVRVSVQGLKLLVWFGLSFLKIICSYVVQSLLIYQ